MQHRPSAKEIATVRTLIADGKIAEASEVLRKGLERDPANAEIWFLMAQVARLAGDASMALELIATALGRQPRKAEFLIEKGTILAVLGRVEEARAVCERGLELDRLNHDSHAALGRYHLLVGQREKAVLHLQAAGRLRPEVAETFSLLGHILMDLGRWEEARASLEKCLKAEPNHFRALWGLGNLHRQCTRTGQAIECYNRALALKPGDPSILSNLGNTWLDLGEHEQAIGCYEQALRQAPNSPVTHSNLLVALHYPSGIDPNQIAQAHRDWAKRHAAALPRLSMRTDRALARGRPLRLGLVSSDFRQHPVGRVAEVICRHLSKERFALFVYDNGPRGDQTTADLQALVPNWRKIGHLPDDAVAKLIGSDGIDILVDLSGHTGGHRLLVFGRQPAPLQMAMFAYPNTTGLNTVHFRITDAHADPLGTTDRFYTERLVRLGTTAWTCTPPSDAPEWKPSESSEDQAFVFGCLNNPSKISSACAQVWSAILRKCPESKLMLLVRNDSEHERRLRAKFGELGVRPDQLWLVPQTSQSGYLGYHHGVDLMLDPFPYNGGVTTWDALWMGVPVLTLAGNAYVSRQGVGLLHNVGLTEYIATTDDELVEKAIASVRHGKRTELMRLHVRRLLQQSPLMDYARYGSELGEALTRLWEEHLARP